MGREEYEENYQVELISVICYLHLPARTTPCVNFQRKQDRGNGRERDSKIQKSRDTAGEQLAGLGYLVKHRLGIFAVGAIALGNCVVLMVECLRACLLVLSVAHRATRMTIHI